MIDKKSVLFICVRNAGRSQMAAADLTYLAGDRVEEGIDIRAEVVRPIRDDIRARIEALISEIAPAGASA